MNWTELSIVVNHDVEFEVTDILEDHGSNGVVIEDSIDLETPPSDKFGEIYELNPEDYPSSGVRLKAYFNELTFNDELRKSIKNNILNVSNLDKEVLTFSEKEIGGEGLGE